MAKVNIRTLDYKTAGSWPKSVQMGAYGITVAVMLLLGWQFLLSGQRDQIASLKGKEEQLKEDFEKKAERASNLEPLKAQLDRMETILAQQLRQLPNKTEMPDLIVDISRVALSSGIQTELFQPGAETVKEFYGEKPIQIRMVGSYHQFGEFVSGVAALPRVVIMATHDISLTPRPLAADEDPVSQLLVMEGTVKTYRSLDEQETQEQERLAEEARKEAAKAKAKANKPKAGEK